jgi:hypothetical protein
MHNNLQFKWKSMVLSTKSFTIYSFLVNDQSDILPENKEMNFSSPHSYLNESTD